jgi:hypothetical protein
MTAAFEMTALGRVRNHLEGAFVGAEGVVDAPRAFEEIGPRGVEQMVRIELELLDEPEGHVGSIDFGDGDRAVEGHDG